MSLESVKVFVWIKAKSNESFLELQGKIVNQEYRQSTNDGRLFFQRNLCCLCR